jgi:nicotinamidase-related amidase
VSTAVVAVHYQNDVVHPEGRIGAGARSPGLIEAAARLLAGARGRGWPVVSVRIVLPEDGGILNSPQFRAAAESAAVREGTWGAAFHDDLRPQGGEPVVTHSRINAFHGSDLERVLVGLGVRRLVVAGVATHSAVEHTARHASDLGYEVVVAADACAAGDPELHDAGLRVLAPHVERVATVDQILGAP